jgi:hypothetical protein
MFRKVAALCLLYASLHGAAYAVCSPETAMNKASDVSDVISSKLQSKPDGASKLMEEMGGIVGNGTVTEQTCTSLDALMVRAKSL